MQTRCLTSWGGAGGGTRKPKARAELTARLDMGSEVGVGQAAGRAGRMARKRVDESFLDVAFWL
jgi:hypothetical protein